MSAIWLPSQGVVDLSGSRVDKAIREYDERLFFARNADTGDYCIFMRNGPVEPPLPIFAFGPNVPSPEAAVARLARSDAIRRGSEILDHIHRSNDDLLRPVRERADDASGVAAETAESFLHRQGATPYSRSLRKRNPKQRSAK